MLCPRYPNWLVVKSAYFDNFLPAEFSHPHPDFRVDGIPIPRSKASIMKIAIIADPTTRAKFFFICFQASTARSRPRRREPNVNFEQSCSIQSSSKGCFRKYVGATGSILSPHLLNNIRSGNKRLVSKIRQTYLSITSMNTGQTIPQNMPHSIRRQEASLKILKRLVRVPSPALKQMLKLFLT